MGDLSHGRNVHAMDDNGVLIEKKKDTIVVSVSAEVVVTGFINMMG